MLTFFQQFPEVRAVMSEKEDGSMKVFVERPEENMENREKFFAKQGIEVNRAVSAELVHKTKVVVIDDVSQSIISGADALVTKEKNIFLSVTVADCLPVFFYDPVAKVIGITHAGWRGLIDGVIDKTLETLKNCGAQTENIFAAFGPSIRECHFEIQADILPQFAKYEKYIFERDGKTFVDLEGIAKNQLQAAGIQEMNIETSSLCTFCEKEKFFSYRRDKPEKLQVMLAVIGMK
jgi:polyphenol oxidase